MIGGRGGRKDDWSSQHERARAGAADRLDGSLEADEAAWLDGHLGSCTECAAVAADYAAQRLELRALRDRAPVPPRDLWARTAAAIEREPRHRSFEPANRSRSSRFRPFALLAGALVVAIAVGTLTSSQWLPGEATTTPGVSSEIAVVTPSPTLVAPTPLAVGPQDVAYLSVDEDGAFSLTRSRFDEVCPAGASECVSTRPSESHRMIGPLASPESVFGSGDSPLILLGDGDEGTSLFAVVVPADGGSPDPSEEPSEAPQATPSDEPSASSAAPESASPPASVTPDGSTSPSPSDEPSPTPSASDGEPVEIARGLEVIDTTAAFAPDGSAFAFTAQPADGSHGPDIYVWTVGGDQAVPVTTDHQSVFGSWSGRDIIGSSLAVNEDGTSAEPTAIVVRGENAAVAIPEAGSVWRPAVDPNGDTAVYWAGSLAPTEDGARWQTVDGRLVIGRWGDIEVPDPSASPASPDGSASPAAPDASASPTTPDASDQAQRRGETTIEEGPLTDWDARWDETGTRLAIWVADPDDPSVGKLSLYVVDPFDGSIDLDTPPLRDEPALAGFSLDDGRLAWAAPPDGGDDGRVLALAWTDDEFGQVESAPGDVLLIR